MIVLVSAPRMKGCWVERRRRTGNMWGSGVEERFIMVQKRIPASMGGTDEGVAVSEGEETGFAA